jgi:hypothetical protein
MTRKTPTTLPHKRKKGRLKSMPPMLSNESRRDDTVVICAKLTRPVRRSMQS